MHRKRPISPSKRFWTETWPRKCDQQCHRRYSRCCHSRKSLRLRQRESQGVTNETKFGQKSAKIQKLTGTLQIHCHWWRDWLRPHQEPLLEESCRVQKFYLWFLSLINVGFSILSSFSETQLFDLMKENENLRFSKTI